MAERVEGKILSSDTHRKIFEESYGDLPTDIETRVACRLPDSV